MLKDENENYKIFAHSLGNLILAGAIENNKFSKNSDNSCPGYLTTDKDRQYCGVRFVSLAA